MARDADAAHSVAAIFHDVPHFQRALEALTEHGFGPEAVSILSGRRALAAEYGAHIPSIETLEDDPAAPREPLSRQSLWRDFAHAVGEGLGIVSLYAVAGASFFVGGPIGVASVSSGNLDLSVEAALDRYIDDAWAARYREAVEEGGVVCWVHAEDSDRAAAAARVLSEAGGDDVHILPGAPRAE